MKKIVLYFSAPLLMLSIFACGSAEEKIEATADPVLPTQVTLWLNAFIPNELPGLTHTVPAGPYKDKTAINGPTARFWYLTDLRGYSANPAASHRMQSLLVLDINNYTLSRHVGDCDPTIELNVNGFGVTCNETAPATGITITVPQVTTSGSQKILSFTLVGAGRNGCITTSPDINWNIPMQVKVDTSTKKVIVTANGLLEPFPAFEMYAKTDVTPAVILFQNLPQPGASPWNLGGPANVPIRFNKSIN